MLNKIKKDNKGFTIIEVLIVLAIAGLIMLTVFLAVPSLQRQQTAREHPAHHAGAGPERATSAGVANLGPTLPLVRCGAVAGFHRHAAHHRNRSD